MPDIQLLIIIVTLVILNVSAYFTGSYFVKGLFIKACISFTILILATLAIYLIT